MEMPRWRGGRGAVGGAEEEEEDTHSVLVSVSSARLSFGARHSALGTGLWALLREGHRYSTIKYKVSCFIPA